jgi:glutaminyl-tRNA synthetase
VSDTHSTDSTPRRDFIRELVIDDIATGRFGRAPATRFPPEPNGFLHMGHAKSICLNFGIAREFGGTCNLRFDDTNPFTEDMKYVEAIRQDVRWLGFDWDGEYYASDYFEQLYSIAERLVEQGRAYVDSQTEEEIRTNRGTVTTPGVPGPYRDRSPAENLDLLRRMKAGEFADGAHVLRAKIDLAHPNMIMRDPLPRRPPLSSWQRVEDLSAVRFCAWTQRCPRRHHAVAVHAGVQGQSRYLRMVGRGRWLRESADPDRVCAA